MTNQELRPAGEVAEIILPPTKLERRNSYKEIRRLIEISLTARDKYWIGVVGKLEEVLNLAWRDIFEWEATAKGLRELPKSQLQTMLNGTVLGEKSSEKVRLKITKALADLEAVKGRK